MQMGFQQFGFLAENRLLSVSIQLHEEVAENHVTAENAERAEKRYGAYGCAPLLSDLGGLCGERSLAFLSESPQHN